MTGLGSEPWGFTAAPPSRTTEHDAGWGVETPGRYLDLVPTRRRLNWLSPVPLWMSRNDRVAGWFGDPTDEVRTAWLERMSTHPDPARDLDTRVVDRFAGRDRISVALLGDPGEGDASQYVVVPVLETVAGGGHGCDLAVVVSDVIYPAGGVDTYADHHHRAYRDYRAPIYGLPGNHDWYDDLLGFMAVFCGQPPDGGPPTVAGPGPGWRRALRRLTWRRAPRASQTDVDAIRREYRPHPDQQATQPGPYCAVDAGPVRLVLIDTGLHGGIDADQADWLRRVSYEDSRPKILLTGKPLLTYARYQRCEVRDPRPGGPRSVDEIVTDPAARYLAVIGGDDHNYQRYPVDLGDGRTLLYLVAGGSGAYMSATHTIPNLDTVPDVDVAEEGFRCYPLRGDSLAYYSHRYDRILGLGRGLFALTPVEATRLVAKRLGMTPPRGRAGTVSWIKERIADVIYRLPTRGSAPGHNLMSVLFDGDNPPLFKSFLRLDATADEVVLSLWSATGSREHEQRPAAEDVMRARRDSDGRWTWTSETPGRATP
ncbi:hypothetical protein [Pseudonocardia endophytica]|uniref:Calcineurin-like phosphoesterase family protein n=1 Tax=Pseudonocardia endophytica TaxID=401976 RepID=A0A4V2PHE5_PSEEN|nr:hypothetical protein [Pseudonocardia endophytica]TCK20466.1 hypothetical protein EV378_4425 [Pseudonocardia endophytica]